MQFLSRGRGIGGLNMLSDVSDMSILRSGRGCTAIPGGEFSVLVTSGTQGFGQAAMANAKFFLLELQLLNKCYEHETRKV